VIKRAGYFFRAIEPTAESVHFEDDRTRAAGLGGLKGTTQKREKRRRNLALYGRDDYVAFVNDFPGLPDLQRGQGRDQNEDRQFLHCLESVPALSKFGIASESKRAKNKNRVIPSETIEQVAAANDIVEVIGAYFPLKRAGANFKALCPFHQEKTPSFHVNPQRQTFHCFGCGVGGSAFRFVMEYEHVDFPSAVRKLAGRVGIPVVEERASVDEDRQHEARRKLLRLHGEATEWFHDNLLKREIGAAARDYLKGRGIDRQIAK